MRSQATDALIRDLCIRGSVFPSPTYETGFCQVFFASCRFFSADFDYSSTGTPPP
jgi:hypothetical protein